MSDWHQMDVEQTLATLQVDPARGLSGREAEDRRTQYGENELVEKGGKSPLRILWDQVRGVLVLILLIAAIISFFLGEHLDAAVILVIVFLNTLFGFWQEYNAEKAIAALKKLSVPKVRTKRDSEEKEISARDIVPGDIIRVEAGNRVPADARIIDSVNLKVQESALTGESEPTEKVVSPVPGRNIPLGDRMNMAYMGTTVTYGRGTAVVTETGMRTEIGNIASMIQDVEDEPTPLQKRLARLGNTLAISALGLIAVVVVVSLLRGEGWKVTFMTAISMAVAAIPEGLPAVVTIALALGAKKMLARHSLIRRLPAVESLGSVTVICSDKTGTLTQNRMTVTTIETCRQNYAIQDLVAGGKVVDPSTFLLLTGGALCNDAYLKPLGSDGTASLEAVGDPTESALVFAAEKVGISKPALDSALPRIAEFPFDSERKRMTTIHRIRPGHDLSLGKTVDDLLVAMNADALAFTKGSADGLIEISSRVLLNGKIERMTATLKDRVKKSNERLAAEGVRVLGVAFKPLLRDRLNKMDEVERDLVFLGVAGMVDPPRPEAKDAVEDCTRAGIRPVMITGDHPLTALSIARELGIATGGRSLTGSDLARMEGDDLQRAVRDVQVFARVSPEHKLKIVDAFQSNGHIVAMTGDGVNDAPALKSADIGVAMGITGTDVSRESADMVLLDDNFATIVRAVREGRIIYDNIRKFITYILTGNFGEIVVMLLAPLLGMPLPLLPIQILWINLVTDGAPALAMSYEPGEDTVMTRPPYQPAEGIFARGVGRRVLWVGLLVGLISLGVGFAAYSGDPDSRAWQTMTFSTVTFCQLAFALTVRMDRQTVLGSAFFRNRILLLSVVFTLAAQFLIVYSPFFQKIFKTVSLSPGQVLVCLAVSLFVAFALEGEKLLLRRCGQEAASPPETA